MKIIATFRDGTKRVLTHPSELQEIDNSREAMFVMKNGRVFTGYCDGDIDEDGQFFIMRTIWGFQLPYNRLVGWCYK